MEIIKKLELRDRQEDFQFFKSLNTGKYSLSIQGSKYHYCSPRKTTKKENYTHMEIAIFNQKGWFSITRSKNIKAFPKYKTLIKEHADNLQGKATVFAYVPIELIEELYQYLKTL